MGTILEKIVSHIPDFLPVPYLLEERPVPIDIIPMIADRFFVIAETKKGSPSKGIIRDDYRPGEIAVDYQRAGASAVSVITEENFFYGSKEHLPMVKAAVDLPVLRKDFLVHPYQVYESYNMGADFVLLIAACLTDRQMDRLYHLALSMGMQVLLEVHVQEELERVLKLEPGLIGINNRDLKTFNVDLNTSFNLKKRIPDHIFVISESGISSNEDIDALKKAGFAGVLIGESLLKQRDSETALRNLLSKTEEPK